MRKLVAILSLALLSISSAFAQLGSLTQDLVFTPLTPCRILDTRTSQGGFGPIAADGTKNIYAFGLNSYVTQTGSATNCGIPASRNAQISAVAVNLAVVTPSAQGWITAYPVGTPKPVAATLNYNTGETVVSNSAILKTAVFSLSPTLAIYSSAQTDVVADIVGYFSAPEPTALECETTTPVTVAMTTGPSNGVYYGHATASACSAGYTAVNTICGLNLSTGSISAVLGTGCYGNHVVSGTTISASQRCCRVPGL